MQSSITKGVEVIVETFYQYGSSKPILNEYLFAYRITLVNHNAFPIQLLRRNWFIFDSIGERKEVEGEGVVGEQPVLAAGDTFQYTSGCNLKSDMGTMKGHYTMINLNTHSIFEAAIPAFQLIATMKLS